MPSPFYTVITGASEGFGKALSIECARRNMNLILVALPGIELHQLAALIRKQFHVDVFCIEKDLCEENSCQEVFNEVKAMGLPVNMLFNNAGVGSTEFFEEVSISIYERQIKLNVLATTRLTRLFFAELKQNKPSYILNVGSLASFFPLPKKQVYGATKSFISYFSKSLRKELANEDIHVSVLCPGGMFTNWKVSNMIQNGSYLSRVSSMNPETVAVIALQGLLRKQAVIVPGRLNKFFLLLKKIVPPAISGLLIKVTMRKLRPELLCPVVVTASPETILKRKKIV
jgi:short-subunit dehydrogenase